MGLRQAVKHVLLATLPRYALVADAGSAQLLGDRRPMINALARLGGLQPGEMPQAFEAHGIQQSKSRFLGLFASHPPIEERIAALQARA